MIENAIGSYVGSGTVVSRRPVIDKSTPSPTSIQKKSTPTTEIHSTIVDEGPSTEDQELPSPTTVKHENHEEPGHQDDPKPLQLPILKQMSIQQIIRQFGRLVGVLVDA